MLKSFFLIHENNKYLNSLRSNNKSSSNKLNSSFQIKYIFKFKKYKI